MIYLYTDGAAKGNPGPGGYGVLLKKDNFKKELSGGFKKTTNNRMELLAVIIGLEALKKMQQKVLVVSDSKYVVDSVKKAAQPATGPITKLLDIKISNVPMWFSSYSRFQLKFYE